VAAGFLRPDHGFDPEFVFEYIQGPYEPFMSDTSPTPGTGPPRPTTAIDIQGHYGELIKKLNMPTS